MDHIHRILQIVSDLSVLRIRRRWSQRPSLFPGQTCVHDSKHSYQHTHNNVQMPHMIIDIYVYLFSHAQFRWYALWSQHFLESFLNTCTRPISQWLPATHGCTHHPRAATLQLEIDRFLMRIFLAYFIAIGDCFSMFLLLWYAYFPIRLNKLATCFLRGDVFMWLPWQGSFISRCLFCLVSVGNFFVTPTDEKAESSKK